ncbi:MAG: choice-of-anchor tandem repeat GloVer-containing protein [Candidatus Cybelea sp.]
MLYSFGASEDGANPYAGLVNINGTLYGTTAYGGANGDGTVFSITPSGTETVLYSFKGGLGDGEYPFASPISIKGTLYGTTSQGGANCSPSGGCGTVFSITYPERKPCSTVSADREMATAHLRASST